MVPARGKAVVRTQLAIAIPHGTYARIAPRSGLAVKHFVDTGAGVVDEDYRGEVGVVLFNHGDQDFQGALGSSCAKSRVAKLKNYLPSAVPVCNELRALCRTARHDLRSRGAVYQAAETSAAGSSGMCCVHPCQVVRFIQPVFTCSQHAKHAHPFMLKSTVIYVRRCDVIRPPDSIRDIILAPK